MSAASLRVADVGIAMGGGTDVALLKSRVADVVHWVALLRFKCLR